MQSSRTFRIFVSSTFSDLKGERNALQEKVFPRLRDLAAAHGCRFQAIDLRWGVSEEAALDQQTMKICLGEIERCQKVTPRPNFIILLGDRYGWRPLPYEIPAGEFEQIISLVTKEEKELLEQWYRRDDNTVPPVYLLQPRGSKFVEYETWEKIETRLRQVFLSVLQKISISPDAALKYAASATELEIVAGALKVQNAQEHVFGFFREIQGLPQDSEDFGNPDADAAQRQGELRGRLKEQLPGNIHEYTARWQGDGPSLDHIDQLCEDVYADLSRVILAEINQLESVDPLDKEISAHDDFRKDRARIFIGRTDILKAISDYIDSINPHPLVVWGVSGSGKSALMAKAVQQARDSGNEVLCRFIGATPESSNGRSLLESLCKQISHRYGADETTIPSEYNDLVQGFPERLVLAKSGKPLILFLDALDQLSDMNNARNLAWLADELPPNVHLIVSTLPGECLDRLERRLPEENRLELQPMPMVEGETLLDLWLAEAGRTLQPEQRADVLNKYQLCGLPLYLRLAFEEVRRWRSYDGLPAGADDQPGLGEEIPGILHDLFWRLSQESNHGQVLVERSLGYLAASKNGLSEDEIMDLLSMDTEVLKDFRVRLPKSPDIERLPVVVWSRLYVDLEPYLTERSADGTALMAFYHRQLGEVAAEEYLVESVKKERHCALAQYFQAQPFQGETEGKGIPNLRKLSELPYQQTQGRMWSELEALLTDLEFIETKCAAQKTYDLVADYTSAFNELPEMQEEKRRECERDNQIALYTQELICVREQKRLPLPKPPASVRVWTDEEIERDIERINKDPSHLDRIQAFAQFVNSEAHNFARYALQPMFCIQQAYNQADSGPVAQTAKHAIGTTIDAVIILRTPISLPPFNPHPACLRTLEGHLDVVEAVGISTNGHLAVSGGWENTLHVWDIALGQCLRILEGHSGIVWAVSLTPDGRLAVSGSADNTLRLWEVETGRCLQTLRGHSEGVSAVSVSPDGNLAISGSFDKTLRIWDIGTGQCLRILRGHSNHIRAVSLSADGRIAVSGSEDRTLRVWEVETGRCLRTLEGHLDVVNAVSLSADGHLAVSGAGWELGLENVLRVWDIETGRCLRTLNDHSEGIRSVSLSADGHLAVSGDNDKILRIWDVETGKCIRSLEGHSNDILAVGISAVGHVAVTGSFDKTLRVWNIETGKSIRPFERNLDYIYVVCFSIDGCRVFSGSGDRELPDTGNKALYIWDVETGRCNLTLEGHTSAVRAIGLAPDGHVAVSGSFDKTLRVWDLETGRCLRILEGHTGWVDTVGLTPDGRLAVSGSADNTLRLWEVETGRCLQTLRGHSEGVSAVSVSPDGNLAISGGSDKTLRVWDLETGQCLRILEGHIKCIDTVSLTPDGRLAVSGDASKTLRIWDVKNGLCIRTLEGHSEVFDDVNKEVCLTTDGRVAISSSKDKTLRLWNIETGLCLAIVAHSAALTSIAVKRDQVVAGDEVGNLLFFEIHNLKWGPSIVTPVRLWKFGIAGRPGAWDSNITVFCEWCSKRFVVQPTVLDTIMDITTHTIPNQIPSVSLPQGAWDEPRLLSECPLCNQPLRYNPFIVDNRDRY